MSRYIFTLIAISLTFFPIPVASYTHYRDAESCDLVGDGDIYGKGIRYSLYIQCFTLILAPLGASTQDVHALRIGLNAVATAVIFNFLKDIPRKGFLFLEFWIIVAMLQFILWVCNWISFMFVLKPVMRDTRLEVLDPTSLLLSVFFFIVPRKGADKEEFWGTLSQSVGYRQGCEAKMNFYGNSDLYHKNWVAFLKAMCILSIPLIVSAIMNFLWIYFMHLLGFFDEFEQNPEDEPKSAPCTPCAVQKFLVGCICSKLDTPNWPYTTPPRIISGHKVSRMAKWCAAFGFVACVSSVIWTENTIDANNIDLSAATITSSGQLIPLIVTAFTSVPTLWSVFRRFVRWCIHILNGFRRSKNTLTDESTGGIDLGLVEPVNESAGSIIAETSMVDAGDIV
ncbi:uncharacterized protein TRIVIDRAFT_64765 [Trichoderma virens Gv29-8]|uniref:Uncharacterized protein n=1 Tax=Hypocrea virens (strain Gv29-8 / FGSC 10586) TaxID=413071 RepID=G9NC95_HYPVG|nr:uncharacterized protein TRIVIDRAFT_64765 [Trichoderma virens Gv29-8]EHK15320.1 hypothetical protein TRIVIDRAFT_64765 [Trichoderma virens Gv29-8]